MTRSDVRLAAVLVALALLAYAASVWIAPTSPYTWRTSDCVTRFPYGT